MDEVPTETPASVRLKNLTNEEKETIDKLITKLPEDMTNKQRKRVKALLFHYQSIILTRENDIGWTNLVEHRIDTGEHQPIRQALRRHPFRHLDWIDNEVNEMVRHGIVKPAASLGIHCRWLTTVLMPWLDRRGIARWIFALDAIIYQTL